MKASTTLAELAVTHPAAARVFRRHRLDFCCGGRRPLDEVCQERQLDANAILASIAEEDPLVPELERWDVAPLPALIAHITSFYHARLREQLARRRCTSTSTRGTTWCRRHLRRSSRRSRPPSRS